MKILKYISFALAALLVGAVVYGLVQGNEWTVIQAIEIESPPEDIAPLIADFNAWEKWTIWPELDPEADYTIGGDANTPGHWMSWVGPEMGNGKLTLETITPNKITYTEMIQSEETNGKGSFTLDFNESTNVTSLVWKDEGKLPPVIGGLFRSTVEDMLNTQFGDNLKRLKKLAEKRTASRLAQIQKEAREQPEPPR